MDRPFIVAAVQLGPVVGKPRDNVRVAQLLAFEAASKGARVVVLPELCTSGAPLTLDQALGSAQPRNGWQTAAFVPIAQKFGCHIVLGYVELQDGRLYDSAVVVGPLGPVGNAQKHNLSGHENVWATPSELMSPLVVAPEFRLGVLICRDVSNRYRESSPAYRTGSRFYEKGEVDIIAVPANWAADYAYPDSAWVDLAEEAGTNVVVANRVGTEADMSWKGGSCVVDRNRKVWTNGSSFTDTAVVGGIVLP